MPSIYAESMRRLREDAGLSRRELAEKTGLAEHLIGRIESGDTAEPRLVDAMILATTLGATPNEVARMFNAWEGEPDEPIYDSRSLSYAMMEIRSIASLLGTAEREDFGDAIASFVTSYRNTILRRQRG